MKNTKELKMGTAKFEMCFPVPRKSASGLEPSVIVRLEVVVVRVGRVAFYTASSSWSYIIATQGPKVLIFLPIGLGQFINLNTLHNKGIIVCGILFYTWTTDSL